MRILSVSAFFESHGGGIEIVAGSLARALGRAGHDSRWAAASLDVAPQDPLVECLPLRAVDPLERFTGLPMPLLLNNGRHLLREEVRQADAVIVHDALYASSLAAACFARSLRKPWMLIQHIGAIPYASSLLRLTMKAANALATRPLLAQATQAVFISDQVRGYFADVRFRHLPMLIFNGVEPVDLPPS